jgi:hypothetical protein
MAGNDHFALNREEILKLLSVYRGITTADGAADGSTLIDSNLIGENDFISEKAILIMSGDAKYEEVAAASFDNTTGAITLGGTGFSAQIVAGIPFRVLNVPSVNIDIEVILEQVEKLAGLDPESDSVVANWNSGVASSGNPGADLCSFGVADTRYKVHSLLVNMGNLSLGATVTVRLYMEVNGAEQEVYYQEFTQGTDPDGLWVINGTLAIHEAIRVEVHSNNVADDGLVVDYDYMLEEM